MLQESMHLKIEPVTADDYESLIPSKIYPETESISVFGGEELNPPQYGKVFISIKPRFGDFLPNLIKENIKLKLKKICYLWNRTRNLRFEIFVCRNKYKYLLQY